MNIKLLLSTVLVLAALLPRTSAADGEDEEDESLGLFLMSLERIAASGRPEEFLALLAPEADRESAEAFARSGFGEPGVRAVIQERERLPDPDRPPGSAYVLIVDVLLEQGNRARVETWRLDIVGEPDLESPPVDPAAGWRVEHQARISAIEGLHRLQLDPVRQHAVNLTVQSEDLTLHLPRGSMFMARIEDGPTAVVLLGRGEMVFSPTPAAERGQVRIFSGSETLRTRFDAAFMRLNPADVPWRITAASLTEESMSPRELAQAQQVLDEGLGNSYGLDLRDLSRDTWSLIPSSGDFLAEIRTRRHGTLTYVRAWGEAEDISLFDRRRRRNIALYASEQKLASRGRYYSEDDFAEYRVLHYDVEASFNPAREWVDGRTSLRIRIQTHRASTINLRLAEALAVHSVFSEELGRLLHLRVRGQNSLLVSLPETVPRDGELELTVRYSGRIESQTLGTEFVAAQAPGQIRETVVLDPEPSYLYSNRSYWYAQAPVSQYATARLRITVPPEFDVIASGEQASGSPVTLSGSAAEHVPEGRLFVFFAPQPLRYLACVISRFRPVAVYDVEIDPRPAPIPTSADAGNGPPSGASGASRARRDLSRSLTLRVESNPRQLGRARTLGERAADMTAFYGELIGDLPYQSFTLGITEHHLPGGHSPAYFAILHQPVPGTPFIWRHDPVSFASYPHFFLAHELAHQWWGQAVGWQNYREQWISEGFAQYLAALYARHDRGDEVFTDLLRQMRRSALRYTDQGPIFLGYRLGHLQNDGRIFRAVIYNKSAVVLHMLRRLMGDEAFFRGLRRLYDESRFQKAGTGDVRRAFEEAAGFSLERFFERWIHESDVPRLSFRHRVDLADPEGPSLFVRFEQLEPEKLFDVPVTVSVTYRSGDSMEFVVPVTERVVETRVALAGPVRRIEANRDHAALAHIGR